MRSVENSGLGATTPVLAQPGRVPLLRMLFKGQRGSARVCESDAPSMHYNPAMAVDVCDADGSPGMQCSVQSPVTALSGLGVLGCKSLDLALDSLKQTMKAAEEEGVLTSEYTAAKESSVWDISVVIPYIGDDCEKYTNEALRLESNLRRSLHRDFQERLAPAPSGYTPSDRTGDTIKVVAIALGATVAVGGIIYLVGPFVRAAAKAGARRLR